MIAELLKRWQSLAEDAIPSSVEWIFERAELKEETAKALRGGPDEHYGLAQKVADEITPILMRYHISLPVGQNPDHMRDALAFAVASFIQREG